MTVPLTLASGQSANPEVARQRVEEFVREWTDAERGKSLRCRFFALIHLDAEGEREPITMLEVQWNDKPKESEVAAAEIARQTRCAHVAQKLVEGAIAATDAASGRVQRFSVCSYLTMSSETPPLGQVFFKLESSAKLSVGLAESEGPTEQGALAQSMRWSENFARVLVAQIDRTNDRMERIFDRMSERLERAEDRNMALVDQREKLLDQRAERGVATYKAQLGLEREDRMWRTAEVFGTQALAKWLGLDVKHPLVQFLQSLTPEEGAKVFAALPPEKQAALAEAVKTVAAASGASAAQPPRPATQIVVAAPPISPPKAAAPTTPNGKA